MEEEKEMRRSGSKTVKKKLEILQGEYAVITKDSEFSGIKTAGLESCNALVMYDEKKKILGMAHIDNESRAEYAVAKMSLDFLHNSSNAKNVWIKIFYDKDDLYSVSIKDTLNTALTVDEDVSKIKSIDIKDYRYENNFLKVDMNGDSTLLQNDQLKQLKTINDKNKISKIRFNNYEATAHNYNALFINDSERLINALKPSKIERRNHCSKFLSCCRGQKNRVSQEDKEIYNAWKKGVDKDNIKKFI